MPTQKTVQPKADLHALKIGATIRKGDFGRMSNTDLIPCGSSLWGSKVKKKNDVYRRVSVEAITGAPAAGQAAPPKPRLWRVSGLWEMFRLDHADISARTIQEAKRKFRNRYKNKRSVTSINAYPA